MKYCDICGEQYEFLIDIGCCTSCITIRDNLEISLRCISGTVFLEDMPVGSIVRLFDDYADKPIYFPVFPDFPMGGKAFYRVGDVLLWLTNNWLSVIEPGSDTLGTGPVDATEADVPPPVAAERVSDDCLKFGHSYLGGSNYSCAYCGHVKV